MEQFSKIGGINGFWLNMPFDPIAAKEAEKTSQVIIIGKDVGNLKKVLEGDEFKGTVIE